MAPLLLVCAGACRVLPAPLRGRGMRRAGYTESVKGCGLGARFVLVRLFQWRARAESRGEDVHGDDYSGEGAALQAWRLRRPALEMRPLIARRVFYNSVIWGEQGGVRGAASVSSGSGAAHFTWVCTRVCMWGGESRRALLGGTCPQPRWRVARPCSSGASLLAEVSDCSSARSAPAPLTPL